MAASASYAAKKGLLVVCSAGNSGMDEWKKITPPADAEDILTIGAIDNMGVNAAFSSIGNTADGRIKPDVMAMGVPLLPTVLLLRRLSSADWWLVCGRHVLGLRYGSSFR